MTIHGLLVQREDAWLATRKSGFDSPAGPLIKTGSWSNGKTSGWQSEDPGSTPGGSTERKVAGYGWPGRSAKAVLARRDEGSNPLPSAGGDGAMRLDGETDDHSLLLTRRSGFESWSGH